MDEKEVYNKEESEDKKEEGNLRYGVYKQPLKKGLLAWRIDGLFKKDDFKTKNFVGLKMSPPKLIVEDEEGQRAEFILTKKMTEDLTESLNVLNDAYKGFPNRKKVRLKDLKNIRENWREWPLDLFLLLVATVAFIVSLILRG